MTEDTSPENLRKFLESDDPALVRMGLSMAKGTGVSGEMLGEILWMYMFHDNATIRTAAKSTFMKLAPEDAKQAVKENWKVSYRTLNDNHSDPSLRYHFRELGILGKALCQTSVSLVEPLIGALSDNSIVRRNRRCPAVISALGEIGDERAVEPLIKMLNNKSQPKRMWATIALGKIGSVKGLIIALGNKNKFVRNETVKILGKIGDKRTVEPLIKVLKDKSRDVRESTVQTLGDIGDVRALGPLITSLKSSNSQFEKGALAKIVKASDIKEKENIIKFLKSDDQGMVQMGASMLKGILEE